jgi:hypothetical protein
MLRRVRVVGTLRRMCGYGGTWCEVGLDVCVWMRVRVCGGGCMCGVCMCICENVWVGVCGGGWWCVHVCVCIVCVYGCVYAGGGWSWVWGCHRPHIPTPVRSLPESRPEGCGAPLEDAGTPVRPASRAPGGRRGDASTAVIRSRLSPELSLNPGTFFKRPNRSLRSSMDTTVPRVTSCEEVGAGAGVRRVHEVAGAGGPCSAEGKR